MKKTGGRGNQGFTLIEVLLVVAILGMIMYSIYMTFTSTLRAKGYVEDISNMRQQGRAFMKILTRELSSAYLVPQSYLMKQGGQNISTTYFIGVHDSYNGRDMDKILFTSLGHLIIAQAKYSEGEELPIGQSEHSVVAYFWRSEHPGVIYHLDYPAFVNIPATDFFTGLITDTEIFQYPIVDNVVELSIQYYDWIQKDWKNEWDSTKNNQLPSLVKASLTLEDSEGKQESFFNLVEIPRGTR